MPKNVTLFNLAGLLFVFIVFTFIYFTKDIVLNTNQLKNQDYLKINEITYPVINLPQKIASKSVSQTATPVYTPQTSGSSLKVPILMYHYISDNPNPLDKQRDYLSTSPTIFREHLKYLSENGYSTISLDTLYAALIKVATIPSKPVILTFDDGYADFYYNAYPILREFNMHATVFIITGSVNQGYYLSWNQIKEMSSSGLITFGSHLVHHYNISSLSPSSAEYELTESKKVLQDRLGVPINFVAYPFGFTSELAINLAKKAGYIGGVGTWPGSLQSEGTIYDIPRFRINGFITTSKLASYL